MTLIEAVQSAQACEKHRAAHECFRWVESDSYWCVLVGGPPNDPDYYENKCVALSHASDCHACAQSIADAVLVAARNGGWERAMPTETLKVLAPGDWPEIDIVAELRRREKETR